MVILGPIQKYIEEILQDLYKLPNFDVIKVIKREFEDPTEFAEAILHSHYRRYKQTKEEAIRLLNQDNEVTLIILLNKQSRETYVGNGAARHIECQTLRELQTHLSQKYELPNLDQAQIGCSIFTSDTEQQTNFLLKRFGYQNGLLSLTKSPNIFIAAPSHIRSFNKFKIKSSEIGSLFCRINTPNGQVTMPIIESPHFRALKENISIYEDYTSRFRGREIQDNHISSNFLALYKIFQDKSELDEKAIIIVEKVKKRLVILDGLHRASAALAAGHTYIYTCII